MNGRSKSVARPSAKRQRARRRGQSVGSTPTNDAPKPEPPQAETPAPAPSDTALSSSESRVKSTTGEAQSLPASTEAASESPAEQPAGFDLHDEIASKIMARRGQAVGKSSEDVAKERRPEQQRGYRREVERGDMMNDLASQIRARRGGATGRDQDEVDREDGIDKFMSGAGRRATDDAQQYGINPMLDLGGLGHAIGKRHARGPMDPADVIEGDRAGLQARNKEPVPHAATDHLKDVRDARTKIDTAVYDYGAPARAKALLKHQAEQAHAVASKDLQAAVAQQTNALAKVSWDSTELERLATDAKDKLRAITATEAVDADDVTARATVAGTAISALNARARKDIEWMGLLSLDEAAIEDGIHRAETLDDKSVMNGSMVQAWRLIKTNGAQAGRDVAELTKKFTFIATEIKRKAGYNEEETKGKLTGVPPHKRNQCYTTLVAKVSTKQYIADIVAREADVKTLNQLIQPFANIDRLPEVLRLTPNRAHLIEITAKAGGDLDALIRVFGAAGNDPVKVRRWLCTDARSDIARIDDHISGGGNVWCGETCAVPTLLPAGTTRAHIEATAVPKVGGGGPAPGGYAGNRPYGNDHGAPDMLLPTKTAAGAAITYTEYDTKPWTPGVDRGGERFIKASDGRYYYTSNHYRTLRNFP